MENKAAVSYGIIGLGRFGTALASMLAKADKEVIAVDQDENKVKEIRSLTEYAFVVDDLNKETLREIGIQNCDVVVICIGEKVDVSILTTMRVLELGVPRVISKAMSQEQGAVLTKLGAEVVYPERDMAVRVGKKLLSNNILDYIMLDNSVEIRQIEISNTMVGRSVREMELRNKYGLNIIAIENSSGTTLEVLPDYYFKPNDIIVVIGKIVSLNNFEKEIEQI